MTGTIFLDRDELSFNETDGVARVAVVRTGDLSGAVTIEYGITGDTATDNVDFISSAGFVTMAPGQSRVLIQTPILDDNLSEPTETFAVSLINVDSGTLLAPRTARIDILDNENPVVDPPNPPLVSDYDVVEEALVSSLRLPIDFEFSPADDTRLYIAEKGGLIKVADVETGAVLSTFVDLTAQVNDRQDRGLLDIALDPNFPDNPYIYAFYVVDPPEAAGQTGNAGPEGGGNRYAYVSRFTADASNDYLTVVPGSEKVLVGGAATSRFDISGNGAIDSTSDRNQAESGIDPATGEYIDDYLKVDSRSHAGGALAFGPDGALYISTGDGTSFNYADPRTTSVQDLNSLSGKILRVDPETGNGLADNPFVTAGDDLTSNQSKVYQLGLRNPFSMTFDEDGQLFITDTGWNSWEEINAGEPGANFGWPFYEGGDNGVLVRTAGYRDLPEAAAFYNAVETGQIDITAAYRSFAHASAAPGFQVQAITGGNVIYDGDQYPASLDGDYFFADFSQGEIFTVNSDDRRDVSLLYKSDNGTAPVHFGAGPDGYVYYADIVKGQIGRLQISGGPVTEVEDDPSETQYVFGANGPDRFVINAESTEYQWGPTAAQDGYVVWNGSGFDLLYGVEQIGFNDRVVTLDPIGGTDPLTIADDPSRTQYLTGTDGVDTFVIDANAAAYAWGATQDGNGTVVWNATGFDILNGFETIAFNDRSVDISFIGGNEPLVVEDVPDVTQFLTGTDGVDRFVIAGQASDYGIGPTEDGQGVVIWKGSAFDILTNFEEVEFLDGTVNIENLV